MPISAEVWSGDIAYMPTSVRGIWLYLYLVIEVWSRTVVAWDVVEREDPAVDPPCRQRQRHVGFYAHEVAGGAGGALIHLQAKGQQRQPLHGFTVPYLVISAGLPETAVPECGGDLPVRLCILGLVQAPAPQQQRGRANLPPLGARVYETSLQCQHWDCSRNTRCWRQPEVVWINLLPEEYDVQMDQQRSANLSTDSKKNG